MPSPLVTAAPPPPVTVYNNSGVFTTSGQSSPIDTSTVQAVFLSAVFSAISGSTPSFTLAMDQQDAAGNWLFGVISLAAITSIAVNSGYASAGPGMANNNLITGLVRLRWTITGTNPSFTGVLSLVGR